MFRLAVYSALLMLACGWESLSGCGKSKYADAGPNSNMQIGIQEATPNEFPWQVSMQYHNGTPYCGGIIISRNYIMTAAQCTIGKSASDLTLVLGEHDRRINEGTEQTINVSVLINHPEYNDITYANDIALMRTMEPLQLNENIAAVCYPNGASNYLGETAVVSGWGTLSATGPAPTLQYVQFPVISNLECRSNFCYGIDDGMLCAGERYDDDARQVDAGGPLVVKSGDAFYVIGIVSRGKDCASDFAGVYTRVSTYLEWIGLNMQ